MCVWRIKDCQVHSYYLFCIDSVQVSNSEQVLLPGCRRTWPGQSLVGIFGRCKWILTWYYQRRFAQLGSRNLNRCPWHPGERSLFFWKSGNLFRSLKGLRNLSRQTLDNLAQIQTLTLLPAVSDRGAACQGAVFQTSPIATHWPGMK